MQPVCKNVTLSFLMANGAVSMSRDVHIWMCRMQPPILDHLRLAILTYICQPAFVLNKDHVKIMSPIPCFKRSTKFVFHFPSFTATTWSLNVLNSSYLVLLLPDLATKLYSWIHWKSWWEELIGKSNIEVIAFANRPNIYSFRFAYNDATVAELLISLSGQYKTSKLSTHEFLLILRWLIKGFCSTPVSDHFALYFYC